MEFSFDAPKEPILVLLNPTLHSWTIENLVKNAIDAMKGRGKLTVSIEEEGGIVKIKVSDSGIGIPKKQFKSVFEPGFTTIAGFAFIFSLIFSFTLGIGINIVIVIGIGIATATTLALMLDLLFAFAFGCSRIAPHRQRGISKDIELLGKL